MGVSFGFECEKCGKTITLMRINPEDVDVWKFGSDFDIKRRICLCLNCRYKILEFISTPEKEDV